MVEFGEVDVAQAARLLLDALIGAFIVSAARNTDASCLPACSYLATSFWISSAWNEALFVYRCCSRLWLPGLPKSLSDNRTATSRVWCSPVARATTSDGTYLRYVVLHQKLS